MDNISLVQVNSKKPSSFSSLCEIWKEFLEQVPKSQLQKDIALYNLRFIDKQTLKEKMVIDKFIYYLIDINEEKQGFLECFIEEDAFCISEFSILKECKTKENYEKIIKSLTEAIKTSGLLKNKNKIKIRIFINQNYKKDIEILADLNFNNVSTRTRYLGDNHFIWEEILENNYN